MQKSIAHSSMLFASLLALSACGDDTHDASDAGVTSDAIIDDSAAPEPVYPYYPEIELGRHSAEITATKQMVPSDMLPAEITAQPSNNNLDVARFDGRVFLAFRSGPDHFASTETRIHVMSSADEMTWEWEESFSIDADLREPRMLVVDGKLFLYVARLGRDAMNFEPQGMSISERMGDGTWSDLTPFYEPGYLGWRTRNEHGTAYMTTYVGGEHIYDFTGMPISVALLTTTNGRDWAPVDSDHPFVYVGGGSETDFVLTDNGDLLGVIRNEAGDENGLGSMICHAPATDLANWDCHIDPRKYDSPLMFWYDGEAYLIARRNVTPSGNYDISSPSQEPAARAITSQVNYSAKPKRCSLWRYVQGEDRIAYILDLPSRGDTCFPGILTTETPGEFIVYNYSSPIDGDDVNWSTGQAGHTNIYRHVLKFTTRAN